MSERVSPLVVIHFMRTYGTHGGEQQLSQYFGAEPRGRVREAFMFLYRDDECARLLQSRAPALEQSTLWSLPLKPRGAWAEFARLILKLPLLQARFIRFIRRSGADVCVVHGFQAAVVAWPVAVFHRRIHWVYVHRTTKSRAGSNRCFRLLYWPYHAVAGNSHAVVASLARLVPAQRLVVLENGLDWRRFLTRANAAPDGPLPATSGPVIVAVGRLLPHKGQDLVIDAFVRAAALDPRVVLWVVGEGPAEAELRARASASAAADRICFFGRRSDVPAILARASIFTHASPLEGMSNAVLEGMAAGLPSVVAAAPGVSECHLNEITGMIVARNVEALAAGLEHLLANPELCARMGAAARARVREHYSMETNRRQYLELFGRITGRELCVES